MPAIVPSIDRREQGRLFGTVVAGAFDDYEERQAGDQQRDAAVRAARLGVRPRVQRTGGRAPAFRGAGGLARARDASATRPAQWDKHTLYV